jgi:hypothetical protein
MGRGAGDEHDACLPARPPLAAGCRRIHTAHRSLSAPRREASNQADARALRFGVGPESASGETARAEAWCAQLRLVAEPRRSGPAGSYAACAPGGLRQRCGRSFCAGSAYPGMGPVERAGQSERVELRETGAGQQGGPGAGVAAEGLCVDALGASAAAAHLRCVEGRLVVGREDDPNGQTADRDVRRDLVPQLR